MTSGCALRWVLLVAVAGCGSGGGTAPSPGDAGDAAVDHASATGGASGATGGSGAGSGGTPASGGAGGSTATGGTGGGGGTGGAGAGGSGGIGGGAGTGGGVGTGGAAATGGASGVGGASSTGGASGTGGAATGGRGAAGAGGIAGMGGAAGQTFSSTAGAGTVRSYDAVLWARSGHGTTIYQLDWSRDGATIVTTGAVDSTVRVFDARSGRLRSLMVTPAFFTYAVALSPDGAFILTGDDTPAARLWNAATGAGVRTFTGHLNAVSAVAFSPDGATIATGGRDGTVALWSRETGLVQRVLTQGGWIYSLRFSADGALLACASGSVLRLWNPASGQIVRDIPSPMPMPGADTATGLDFTADGTLLIAGSYQKVARVFRVATGELVTTLSGHTDWVRAAAWNATGTRAVTASWDGTIRIWAVPGYAQQQVITTMPVVKLETAVWNPTADELAAPDVAGGTVRVWDGQTAAPLRELTGPAGAVYGLAYSPDGTRLASGGRDGLVRVWNASDGTQTAQLKAGQQWSRAVAWSPAGDRIAAAGDSGAGGIWNATTGEKLAAVPGHGDRTRAVAWSPNGAFVATGGSDQRVVLTEVATGTSRVLTGHTGEVNDVAFSPDGALLASASTYREVKVWDTATGMLVRSLMGGITGSAQAVAFSPDGTVLAAAINQNAGLVQLWRTDTWATTRQLASNTMGVDALAFNADGTKLVAGGPDRTVRVWTVATGAMLTSFITAGAIHDVAFGPGGAHVAFGDDLGTVAVVPVP